jgi:hypothetical protein
MATRYDIGNSRQLARGRYHGEHPGYRGQAVVLEGRSRQAIKQLANALIGMPPIPAVRLPLLIGRDQSRWINGEIPPGLHFLAVHFCRQNYDVHLRNQFLSKCVSQ